MIKSFVFMDIEATDIPSHNFGRSNITEISFYACLRDDLLKETKVEKIQIPRVLHKLTLLFNPGKLINYDASRISDLYNEMLENENKCDENACRLVIGFLKHLQQPVCLVAHYGSGFDFPILKKSLEKYVEIPDFIFCVDSLSAIKRIDEIQNAQDELNNIDSIIKSQCNDKEFTKNNNDQVLEEKNFDCNADVQNAFQDFSTEEFEAVTKLEHKANLQEFNEKTPKKATNQHFSNDVKKELENFKNDNVTPSNSESKRYNTNHNNLKSRRKLFASSTSSSSSPYKLKNKNSYKLRDIYCRIFGSKPIVEHHAEDDVHTLLKIVFALGENFVEYADEKAIKFSTIETKGYR